MKTILRSFLITAALVFGLTLTSNAQTTHEIILSVDTENIVVRNLNEYCDFGQDSGTNEEYTITVEVGDTIIWKGVPRSIAGDIVNITAINYEGGENIFGQNVIRGNGATPEIVTAVAQRTTPDDAPYKYRLQFTVIHNGEKRGGTFNIDPFIKVK